MTKTSSATDRGCRCGRPWRPVRYSNSGTTEVTLACPIAAHTWGANPHVWRWAVAGHEFVVTTKPAHAATGCCDIWDVRTAP
jgi:hypothetical protein